MAPTAAHPGLERKWQEAIERKVDSHRTLNNKARLWRVLLFISADGNRSTAHFQRASKPLPRAFGRSPIPSKRPAGLCPKFWTINRTSPKPVGAADTGTTLRTYTAEFKREALYLLESSGKTASAVAKDLGFNSWNLTYWRKETAEDESGLKAHTGHGLPRDKEVDRLRRENTDLHWRWLYLSVILDLHDWQDRQMVYAERHDCLAGHRCIHRRDSEPQTIGKSDIPFRPGHPVLQR